MFVNLKTAVENGIDDAEARDELLDKIASMKKTHGTPGFTEKYKDFVASAADHMTILAPLLPLLTALLS